MASSSTPSDNEPAKVHILVQTVQLKPKIKTKISGRMVPYGSVIIVRFSILGENRSNKLMMMMKLIIIIINIMNKSQETMVYSGCQKLTSTTKLRIEK